MVAGMKPSTETEQSWWTWSPRGSRVFLPPPDLDPQAQWRERLRMRVWRWQFHLFPLTVQTQPWPWRLCGVLLLGLFYTSYGLAWGLLAPALWVRRKRHGV